MTGPAAALFLKQDGHEVEVFERAPECEPVGAGFLLQPSGREILKKLGVDEAVSALGTRVEDLRCETFSGKQLFHLHYPERKESGLGVSRREVLGIFMQELQRAEIAVHWGTEVKSVQEVAQGKVVLRGQEDLALGEFDLVIVANGARSALRDSLQMTKRVTPYPWGALWWMGVQKSPLYAHTLHQVCDGCREMAGMMPSGIVDGQAMTSFFWSLSHEEWENGGEKMDPRQFSRWKERVLRLMPEREEFLAPLTHAEQLTYARYFDVRVKSWGRGQVILLGDAVHSLSPQLGQGVNLGLRDAYQLARALRVSGTVNQAIKVYQKHRRWETFYYQEASRYLTPMFQSEKGGLGVIRDLIFPPLMSSQWGKHLAIKTMSGEWFSSYLQE